MENKLHLCVVTQDSTVFERNVSYVNIPAAFGSLGVLGGHAPMVCAVSRGQVRCAFDGDRGRRRYSGGRRQCCDRARGRCKGKRIKIIKAVCFAADRFTF